MARTTILVCARVIQNLFRIGRHLLRSVNDRLLRLVNLSGLESPALLVQAGAFGKHEFTEVRYLQRGEDGSGITQAERKIPIQHKLLSGRAFPCDQHPFRSWNPSLRQQSFWRGPLKLVMGIW